MNYVLIANKGKDKGVPFGSVMTWNGVVKQANFPWMVGREIGAVLDWCRRYGVSWTVTQ